MKKLLFVVSLFYLLPAEAQKTKPTPSSENKSVAKKSIPMPSSTKLVRVHLKASSEKPLTYQNVSISEIVIYGTEEKVMAFLYSNTSLINFCSCGLLTRLQCLDKLIEAGLANREVGPYTDITQYGTRTKVKVIIPQPEDFNAVKSSLSTSGKKTCETNFCLKFCYKNQKPEVCISMECENEVELCFNGEFSVSVSNGNVSVEAKIK